MSETNDTAEAREAESGAVMTLLECGMTFDPRLGHTVALAVAYMHTHPEFRYGELPALLQVAHGALTAITCAPAPDEPSAAGYSSVDRKTPAEIKASITPDALISFLDGKSYKTLKRHLTTHGLDFDGYRQRFGLPADYPTVAASYSAQRSDLAKSLGLGVPRAGRASVSAAA